MASRKPELSFFEKLRKRRYLEISLVYLGSALAVMEFVHLVIVGMGAPHWSFSLVVTLVLVGLPIVLVISWAFEFHLEPTKKARRSKTIDELPDITQSEATSKPGKKLPKILFAIIFSLILFLIAIVLYYQFMYKSESATSQIIISDKPVEKSIAVLPFINLSKDSQQEYFAEGMMDEIQNQLYKIGGLNVISRTSSMAYKDSKKTSKEIANELDVGNLLEGSVQKEGDHIRIIVQLINGKTDQHLWAETYDREFKDVFIIQSDIAQQIAAALKVKIDPETKSRIEYIPTENANAYNFYLLSKERALNNKFDKVWKELLEKVIQLDSSFAPAYADKALYWLTRGIFFGDLNAKQVLDSALPLLKKSIQLDSNLSSAHSYMAEVNLWFEWDFKAAKKEWGKFFQLNPSGFLWVENYVDFLNADGRSFEALDFAFKNRNRDKKDITNWTSLALSYIYVNQPEKGLVILDSAWLLLKHPDVLWTKAYLFIYLGKYRQVIDNLNKYFEIIPNDRKIPRYQAWLAISYFHTGRINEAEKIIDSLQFLSNKSPVGSPAFHLAMIYTTIGRTKQAIQWLEKAYTDHEVEIFWLKVEPLLNSLYNDPAFKDLLSKVGFK